ncbi:hypothetical protein M413DRAFT_14538 [Hebeloma cylindrosporum]|uniref:Uncharacterized protein n=1 Tax=Hebeloma cylindrosporum TaxID=76867 RepID=A0A0C3BVL1_HEBCY|nr:hypothetical protein M413DRAFT_14538 [Hebeloma cylindrosporum h7]
METTYRYPAYSSTLLQRLQGVENTTPPFEAAGMEWGDQLRNDFVTSMSDDGWFDDTNQASSIHLAEVPRSGPLLASDSFAHLVDPPQHEQQSMYSVDLQDTGDTSSLNIVPTPNPPSVNAYPRSYEQFPDSRVEWLEQPELCANPLPGETTRCPRSLTEDPITDYITSPTLYKSLRELSAQGAEQTPQSPSSSWWPRAPSPSLPNPIATDPPFHHVQLPARPPPNPDRSRNENHGVNQPSGTIHYSASPSSTPLWGTYAMTPFTNHISTEPPSHHVQLPARPPPNPDRISRNKIKPSKQKRQPRERENKEEEGEKRKKKKRKDGSESTAGAVTVVRGWVAEDGSLLCLDSPAIVSLSRLPFPPLIDGLEATTDRHHAPYWGFQPGARHFGCCDSKLDEGAPPTAFHNTGNEMKA